MPNHTCPNLISAWGINKDGLCCHSASIPCAFHVIIHMSVVTDLIGREKPGWGTDVLQLSGTNWSVFTLYYSNLHLTLDASQPAWPPGILLVLTMVSVSLDGLSAGSTNCAQEKCDLKMWIYELCFLASQMVWKSVLFQCSASVMWWWCDVKFKVSKNANSENGHYSKERDILCSAEKLMTWKMKIP